MLKKHLLFSLLLLCSCGSGGNHQNERQLSQNDQDNLQAQNIADRHEKDRHGKHDKDKDRHGKHQRDKDRHGKHDKDKDRHGKHHRDKDHHGGKHKH